MKALKVIALVILTILVLVFGFNSIISLFGLIVSSDAVNASPEGIGYFVGYMAVQILFLGLAVWGWFSILKSLKKKEKI